ncbi:MAG: hypothetical protein N2508_01190 [Anaerolineae bacterium]|nr:hypothetical protein [Anaerolineae bacterium]
MKEYKKFRLAGRELNQKIIEAYVDDFVLEKAARALRLGGNRRLVLDSEDELSVLMDFALYEVPRKGRQNLVALYAEEHGGTNAIERELLAAMVKAHTGLFKVTQVLPDECQIMMGNLIVPEEPVLLTDINFSHTLSSQLVVFFRPIRTATLTMTSGVAFVFPAGLEQELVLRWRRLEPQGSAERYAWFFRKNKLSGYETRYV